MCRFHDRTASLTHVHTFAMPPYIMSIWLRLQSCMKWVVMTTNHSVGPEQFHCPKLLSLFNHSKNEEL